jgi:hypothetical protein
MLMMWTCDHPAQCKVEGFNDGGYHACRWDHMVETVHGRQVVYLDNRRQAKFPPPLRSIESILLEVEKVASQIDRNRCVIAKSWLWRLFKLYKFDLSCDLVYDCMHILPLCIFKKYVKFFKDACHGQEADLKTALVEITSKRPSNVGSRWPMHIRERLGYWKANRVYTFYLFLFALCLKLHGIQQRWTIMHNWNFFDRNFPTILLS